MATLDQTIAMAFPMVLAPRENEVEPSGVSGTRFIAANDGLWREVDLPWIRVVHKIADSEIPLPYGSVKEQIDLKFGATPKEVWQQFRQDAQRFAPNEMAAALLWSEKSGQWRYALREALQAGPGHVNYREVERRDGEHLVVDLHSHGAYRAFFSETDDRDDAGSMKFSGVLGGLGTGETSSVLRLNLLGKTWDAKLIAMQEIEVSL